MTYEEVIQAAKIFFRLAKIRNYVSKERFAMMAKTRFGIEEEDEIDVMYGILNVTPRIIGFLAASEEDQSQYTYMKGRVKLLPKAIEIAEAAYALKPVEWRGDDVPTVERDEYRRKDTRRYFYTDGDEEKTIDVDMSDRTGIIMLSELLQREGIRMRGVAEHLGYLEGPVNPRGGRDKIHYFEGDIYFLYGDPTDRMFYDWYSCGGSAGVYVATEKGWRKLLYTPGRGYIDKKGNVEYVDDKSFFSNYKLEQAGMGFLYVGNMNYDKRVLREEKKEE